MSVIFDRKNVFKSGYNFHVEAFDSAMEVVKTCRERKITDSCFDDQSKKSFGKWEGVKSYDEALDLLNNGYQPTVDALRGVFKAGMNGEGTRFSFKNNIVGFMPVVPLALMNLPNCMIDMTMKPIKAKVIDVYYDMTVGSGTDSKDIIKAGQKMLGTIIELERQGYRFNLYAVQTYSNDSQGCDMLVVKVKSAGQPLDLKRISFPLTHTAFFRVIGFDWYSKVPGGTYRFSYGHALAYDYSTKKLNEMAKHVFGKNSVYFACKEIIENDTEYIKKAVMDNGNSKA